ncbi:MAG: peptidoglycan editing factor PgeF [Candidatus Methylomirabilia bacterium]
MSAPAIVEHRHGGMVWFAAEHLERGGVRHGFTTRSGGASRGDYSSLNFSSREGDVPQRVLENWGRLETAAALPADGWALLSQVHGARVERVAAGGTSCHHRRNHAEADGLATSANGVVLGVLTADCLPVIMAVPGAGAVAVAHAGWRGTLGGVVQETVRELCEISGAEPHEILAAIGPAIGRCCLQVGREVHEAFHERWGAAQTRRILEKSDPWRLDLPTANLLQLREAGVRSSNVAFVQHCTCCRKDLFFSYRRDGRTGRMLNFVTTARKGPSAG